MREDLYEKIFLYFKNHNFLKQTVVILGKAITVSIYIFYPLFLLCLYLMKNDNFFKTLLIPLISFIVLSIIRRLLNFPRPYEKYDIKPLYNKSTKGCSFPSRHTFSAFVIAFTTFSVSIPLGSVLTVLAVTLAVTRVLCGIHFIRDVIAGAVFAAFSAICGMLI